MKEISVEFPIRKNEFGISKEYGKGTIIDKFLGVKQVNQEAPSGSGGSTTLKDFKINIDYYLILGQDKSTYVIPCNEVSILEVNIK